MPIANIGQLLSSPDQIGGSRIETAVAKAFLIRHVNDFDRVETNVPIGPPIDLGPAVPAYVQKAADYSSVLRADMVCWNNGAPTIVEFKDRIDPPALGQLLSYWHIMQHDNPKLLNVYKRVAGRTIREGLRRLFDHYGITVDLYPDVIVPAKVSY